MSWDIEYTDQFGDWWGTLDADAQEDVDTMMHVLEERGPALGSTAPDLLCIRSASVCYSPDGRRQDRRQAVLRTLRSRRGSPVCRASTRDRRGRSWLRSSLTCAPGWHRSVKLVLVNVPPRSLRRCLSRSFVAPDGCRKTRWLRPWIRPRARSQSSSIAPTHISARSGATSKPSMAGCESWPSFLRVATRSSNSGT